MFCESCGAFVPDGQPFCSTCGAPVANAAPVSAPEAVPAPVAVPVATQEPQPVSPQPMASQPVAAQPTAPQPVYQLPVAQPVYQQPVAQSVQPMYQPVAQPVYQQPGYSQTTPTVVVQQPVYTQPAKPRGNGFATAGLTFGILTVVFCWISYFCSVFGLLGLVFSIIGLVKKNAPGKGKALAGLILTIIGSVAVVVIGELFWSAVGMAIDAVVDEVFEEVYEEIESEVYSTSYSDTGIESDTYYIDGDFATTDKGYISGVLHIDGYLIEF